MHCNYTAGYYYNVSYSICTRHAYITICTSKSRQVGEWQWHRRGGVKAVRSLAVNHERMKPIGDLSPAFSTPLVVGHEGHPAKNPYHSRIKILFWYKSRKPRVTSQSTFIWKKWTFYTSIS